MNLLGLLAWATIATLAVSGCGDNKVDPDARVRDATGDGGFPAAPNLGMQIDRMGRAAVNTALNHGFDPAADDAKKAYNEMDSKLTEWFAPANVGELAKNLALIDVLDTGTCGNGICELGETFANCPKTATTAGDCEMTTVAAGNGCGNQVLYNGMATGGGAANAMSYVTLATILADDALYLDTGKPTCTFYLGVEFGVVTGGGNSTCGGRTPEYDVIDFSYSMLAMGIFGFLQPSFEPRIKDNVDKHADVSVTAFPFLGEPH